MFPNLRFIYNGFNVEYVGPEESADWNVDWNADWNANWIP